MDRYRVTTTPDGRRVGILDMELMGWCTLPDGHGNMIPLEWRARPAAEAWLYQCYRTWNAWEGNGEGIPPKNWRRRLWEPSPFDRGMQFYS
ncbi:hypothetical protein AB0942_33170 [Streptomyces nodosus]|uniref:hypothetical protein n=1 Tax=Streptomyces nodosus TaxID=40318 RepID=UPI0034549AC3